MPNPEIVHFLVAGRTPCEMRGVPGEWPPGHIWATVWESVTCAQCLRAKIKIYGLEPPKYVVREAAIEIVAPDAGAACGVCHKTIDTVNHAVWAGTPSLRAPAVCICGDCLIAGVQLLFTGLQGN